MDTIQALIKHYIESNGYTVYSISQQSGINRTTLQKILSGQRKITKEIYERLLPFFALSPIDKEELEQAFLIDQIGTERFQTHMEIKRILEMSAATLYQTADPSFDTVVSNIEAWSNCMLIQGTYQIVNAIYSVALKNVTTEAQPFLYTFADMSHPYASIFFKPLYHPTFQPLHVKHLIEYQTTKMDGENYDICCHPLPRSRVHLRFIIITRQGTDLNNRQPRSHIMSSRIHTSSCCPQPMRQP